MVVRTHLVLRTHHRGSLLELGANYALITGLQKKNNNNNNNSDATIKRERIVRYKIVNKLSVR